MITVLIAYGPNSIKIPCMVFDNMDQGKVFCDSLFGTIGIMPYSSKDCSVRYLVDLDERDDTETISKTLFTRHYYGCGGPGPFVLKEVPVCESFIGFDLD